MTLLRFTAGHASIVISRDDQTSAVNTAAELFRKAFFGFVCVCILTTDGIVQTLKESGLR